MLREDRVLGGIQVGIYTEINVKGNASTSSFLMRVLHVGPLPPTASGIADYSSALIPELRHLVDLSVAIADDAPLPSDLPSDVPVYRASELSRALRHRFDVILYQIGNHRFHAWQFRLMDAWPGIVVLHDGMLHHLFADVLLARGRISAYVREVGAWEGLVAARHAESASTGDVAPRWFDDRMIGAAVRGAVGVITHSASIRAAALATDPQARVGVIHHGVDAPLNESGLSTRRDRTRASLAIAHDTIIVGTFGGLTQEKQIESIIDAYAELRRRSAPVVLILGGEEQNARANSDRILGSGIASTVIRTGRLPLDQLEDTIAACDVCVQIRTPTSGEASGIVLRALRLGCPTIVSDEGWFADLPDDAVHHVSVDPNPALLSDTLVNAIEYLIANPEARRKMGGNARELARMWSWPRAATSYVSFFQEVLNARKRIA